MTTNDILNDLSFCSGNKIRKQRYLANAEPMFFAEYTVMAFPSS